LISLKLSFVALSDWEFNLGQSLLSFSKIQVQAFSPPATLALIFPAKKNIKLKHFMWWKVSAATNFSHA